MERIRSKKNHEKFALAIISNFKEGKPVKYVDIVRVIRREYPEIPESSIIPSDYCNNHKNKDPRSGKYHIFKKDHRTRGIYEVLEYSKIRKSCLNN